MSQEKRRSLFQDKHEKKKEEIMEFLKDTLKRLERARKSFIPFIVAPDTVIQKISPQIFIGLETLPGFLCSHTYPSLPHLC
jgi:uncharacterized membrane protein YukC